MPAPKGLNIGEFVIVLITILGTGASVAGVYLAWVSRARVGEIRRRANADLWAALMATRSAFMKLESQPAHREDPKIAEIYGRLTELYRQMLKAVVLDEKDYSESTIQKWRAAGKLDSSWQVDQARHFLSTDAIATTSGAADTLDRRT
jgi:hypothetical protein